VAVVVAMGRQHACFGEDLSILNNGKDCTYHMFSSFVVVIATATSTKVSAHKDQESKNRIDLKSPKFQKDPPISV
jgi:hypothetical protein